jgi:hypothetical protein
MRILICFRGRSLGFALRRECQHFSFSVARMLLQTRNKIMFSPTPSESRTPSSVSDPFYPAFPEESDYVVYRIGHKTFRLNKAKARARLEGKRVINGLRNPELNVMPLKYHEAYRLYKRMKANHWEPDVIDMSKDAFQWSSGVLSTKERWVIEMGIGYSQPQRGSSAIPYFM